MAIVDVDLMRSLKNSRYVESACSTDTLSMYSIHEALWAGKTFCSETVIAETPEFGKVLFLDKELQSAESDEAIYHEHLIHPVMNSMADMPNKRILIVGGGEGATAREVLKWSSVSHVAWIDIDGPLVELCRRHLGWVTDEVYNDPRLHYECADIRTFLANNTELFDIVVLDLPDPDVETLTSYDSEDEHDYPLYGKLFWKHIRNVLKPTGSVVSHTGPIRPGGDPNTYREGLTWIQERAKEVGFGEGFPYHVCIPSFMGEWGFWMSSAPVKKASFPEGLRVMDETTQMVAFTWPKYWNHSLTL